MVFQYGFLEGYAFIKWGGFEIVIRTLNINLKLQNENHLTNSSFVNGDCPLFLFFQLTLRVFQQKIPHIIDQMVEQSRISHSRYIESKCTNYRKTMCTQSSI